MDNSIFWSYRKSETLVLFGMGFVNGSYVHQVLNSCGFQWCNFHSCAFSKNSPNIQLMRFSYISEEIPSLMRFWLKFMFSKKAIKIDKIFTVNLTITKGQ